MRVACSLPPTLKALVFVAAVVALTCAGAAAMLARDDRSELPLVGFAGGPYRGSEVAPDVRLPRFALREWNGAKLSTASLGGKVVLVTFLETRCKEACPIIADQIDLGLARLDARERADVVALAVSTHPGDDTPASVRTFLRNHRVLGELHYLIGTEAQLRPVWRAFRVLSAVESGDADTHSSPVRIFDPQHRWVTTLHPRIDLTPENVAHDVRVALERSS
jgi:protein SCO1/2